MTQPHFSRISTALSLQTENWSLANHIQIHHPLPDTSLPVSIPNTIHHSHLTVWILILDLLPIDFFWLSACEKAGSRNFAFVGAV